MEENDRKKGMGTRTSPCPPAAPDEPVRVAAQKGRTVQATRNGSRRLFDAERRAVFLDWFAGTGNLSWAAEKAGVHYRTVLRHAAEDAAFREAFEKADEMSALRIRAWLKEAKRDLEKAEAEGYEAALDGEGGGEADEAPGGDTAPAHLDVGQALQLIRDHEQRAAARAARAARTGQYHGRRARVATNAEVRSALVKRLAAYGVRLFGEPPSPEAPAAGAARDAEGEGDGCE